MREIAATRCKTRELFLRLSGIDHDWHQRANADPHVVAYAAAAHCKQHMLIHNVRRVNRAHGLSVGVDEVETWCGSCRHFDMAGPPKHWQFRHSRSWAASSRSDGTLSPYAKSGRTTGHIPGSALGPRSNLLEYGRIARLEMRECSSGPGPALPCSTPCRNAA